MSRNQVFDSKLIYACAAAAAACESAKGPDGAIPRPEDLTVEEVVEICEKETAVGRPHPLGAIFNFQKDARPGPNGTKYIGLTATIPGKSGRLLTRFTSEKHVGQIAPLDDIEVARINAERGAKYGTIQKRDRHPSINVQKYTVKVETDDQGRPKEELPGDEHRSDLWRVFYLLDSYFYAEMTARIASGAIILRDPRRKEYPEGAIVVPSTKIVSLVQTHVSMESKTNPGTELANPIMRMNMKFDKETGMPSKIKFFDFKKQHKDPKTGKRSFEPLLFDGHPVTAHNVHEIKSHSKVSGIVNMNAACASNMGISIPTSVEILIVEEAEAFDVTTDDVFGDEDDDLFPEEEKADVATADPPATEGGDAVADAGTAPVPAPAVVSESDLAQTLNDIGFGDQ